SDPMADRTGVFVGETLGNVEHLLQLEPLVLREDKTQASSRGKLPGLFQGRSRIFGLNLVTYICDQVLHSALKRRKRLCRDEGRVPEMDQRLGGVRRIALRSAEGKEQQDDISGNNCKFPVVDRDVDAL